MAKVPSSVQYIRDVFEVTDIDKVWNELERRFHFNVKAWKKEFEIIASNSDRFKDLQEVFLEYGKMKHRAAFKYHTQTSPSPHMDQPGDVRVERKNCREEKRWMSFIKARYTEQ